MTNKQIQRAEALREIVAIRDRLIALEESMEPLPYGLTQQIGNCLYSLSYFEDGVKRDYRWTEESP